MSTIFKLLHKFSMAGLAQERNYVFDCQRDLRISCCAQDAAAALRNVPRATDGPLWPSCMNAPTWRASLWERKRNWAGLGRACISDTSGIGCPSHQGWPSISNLSAHPAAHRAGAPLPFDLSCIGVERVEGMRPEYSSPECHISPTSKGRPAFNRAH